MTKSEVHARIVEIGIIPACRFQSPEDALFAAEAAAHAGIPIMEVPMTTPGGVNVIRELVRRNPEMIVGAGTLFDTDLAHQCLDAGATFLTSTGLDLDIVNVGHQCEVVVLPGALTPTEIVTAFKAGADFVKVFPCAQVGGASYIKALKAPFPRIPLVAAGGITNETVADFILAGASAVGIGGNLFPLEAIRGRQESWVRELTHRYLDLVKNARNKHKIH